MPRRAGSLAALVAVVVIFGAACSDSGSTANAPGSTLPTAPSTVPSTTTTTTTTPDATQPTVPSEDDLAVTRDPFQPQG